jgi:PUA-domain protein
MMREKCRRSYLKDKKAKTLLNQASEKLKLNMQMFETKARVEVMETEFAKIFFINGEPLLAEVSGNTFPTLLFNKFFTVAPKVVVDMGAIPHVCKGANIMAPGIRRLEGEFRKGDFVSVIDEKYGKVLAVGEALCDLADAKEVKQGVVVKNVHFVGDKIWDSMKESSITVSED